MAIDPQRDAARRRIQSEMLILDSDLKKKNRRKADLLDEKKRIKLKLDQIQMEIVAKDQEIRKIDQEIFMLTNDLGSLKKKLNTLK